MEAKSELEDVMDDGSNPNINSENDNQNYINNNISIEIDASPGSNTTKRKPVRRASAEEKKVAELVHRTHLLCLLAHGRLIDNACNDPLIQASLLSLLPTKFLKLSEATNLTVDALTPLVDWFHSNFHVRSSINSEKSLHLALATTLQNHEGTSEEIAALSVALFRALNLLTRFVSILDVVSLKPDGDKSDTKGVFESSTIMVNRSTDPSTSSTKQPPPVKTPEKVIKSTQNQTISPIVDQSNEGSPNLPSIEGTKRKGDIEFEMQMQMALSSTATMTSKSNIDNNIQEDINSNSDSLKISPFKKMKKIKREDSSSSISTVIGSRKVGSPMYWAEVYCNGKWIHVGTINATIPSSAITTSNINTTALGFGGCTSEFLLFFAMPFPWGWVDSKTCL